IIWKHKILWIFGILAGCGRGGGGGGGNVDYSGGPDRGVPPRMMPFFRDLGQWLEHNTWIIAVIILVVIVLTLLAIFLRTIGQIGIIRGAHQADRDMEAPLSFGALFSGSMPYFWRVFGLTVLVGLAFAVLVIPMVLFGIFTAGVGFLCILPLLCLLIPLAIVVGVVLQQAIIAIVVEDLSLFDGLQRGWEVVKSNPGPIALMTIILFLIGAVGGFILAVPVLVIALPVALVFIAGEGHSLTPLWIGLGLLCLYLPIALLLNGVLTSYLDSAWTLTYLRLTHPPEADEEAPVVAPTDA
ncbi:MAG: hypothetical protein D6770_04735, partial [Anaerolineae bacterium]